MGKGTIIGLSLITLGVILALLYGFGAFSILENECSIFPVELDGVHIQSYDELNRAVGGSFSDEEFISIGYKLRDDGMYGEACEEVLTQ